MIEEKARVTEIIDGKITVVSEIKSTCSSCQQVDNCGSGQVAKAFPHKQLKLTLTSNLSLNIGDEVVVGLSEQALLSSAWQVYCWPLIGLLMFSFVGQWLIDTDILGFELLAIILGLFGGYLGFVFARKSQNREQLNQNLAPQVLRIASQNIAVTEITP